MHSGLDYGFWININNSQTKNEEFSDTQKLIKGRKVNYLLSKFTDIKWISFGRKIWYKINNFTTKLTILWQN